jgi:hypothetical protein
MDLTSWTITGKSEDQGLKQLCLQLAKSESEDEVINILRNAGYWNNQSNWRFYGNIENNFSTIGNQQSLPESAIVEKLINSVDALFMRECLRNKIDPTSKKAPENIVEALERFFGISQGSLYNATISQRKALSENISFIATGRKDVPNYEIIDLGEGQTPRKMPGTFLSLAGSNKLRITFVQGKFNMGGTGVLQFAGHNNLQLIITKRDPQIAISESDDTKDCWGFTIVRREDPKEGRRSSAYTYLVINGNIPSFKADFLPLLPGDYPNPYGKPMKWGTFIKLYDYQIPGYKSPIFFDLYNRICLLLPKIALPVRFFERRAGYTGHTMETTMNGLSVRLHEDRRTNLEDGFPSSSSLSVAGENMACQIFAFKKGQSEKYRKDEGVIFAVNGQTHGFIPTTFFNRRSVGMSYLADSILVVVDCSNISGRNREDLFMNSRDRLRSGELKDQIENKLEELLSHHAGLQELREKRRREELQSKLEDSKPLKEVLEDLVKKSPALAALLSPGMKLKTPFNLRMTGEQKEFVGNEFPTYFKLQLDQVKNCPLNRKFRVQYETDASNDYFERDKMPGKFMLTYRGKDSRDYLLNLWSGIATLTVSLPTDIQAGDEIEYQSVVTDDTQINPFTAIFKVKVLEEAKPPEGRPGMRKQPPSDTKGDKREAASLLSLPQVIEVHKDNWADHKFNDFSALDVKDSGADSYDFFVNMDNINLLTEIKARSEINARLLQDQYKYALVLIGMAMLKEASARREETGVTYSAKEVFEVTSKLSIILLPMISCLGELEVEG